ncbi:MAG TPA: fasciclin domain-containing protein [Solirubrobacteraceae bacterium]|nr:fasciclin domain-containing protein [Solirubrobacteraceae bacterium]
MSAAGLFTVGFLVTLIVAAALSLLVYAAILDGRDAAARRNDQPPAPPGSVRNIVETARTAGEFTTLVTAIDRAGLAGILADHGPYTVFAPSDTAFARLPEGVVDSLLASPDTLADVLSYHVVSGRLTTADVARRASAETFQGEDLTISNNGDVRVDGAHVVHGDIEASNGVIHVIDRVLLPARI